MVFLILVTPQVCVRLCTPVWWGSSCSTRAVRTLSSPSNRQVLPWGGAARPKHHAVCGGGVLRSSALAGPPTGLVRSHASGWTCAVCRGWQYCKTVGKPRAFKGRLLVCFLVVSKITVNLSFSAFHCFPECFIALRSRHGFHHSSGRLPAWMRPLCWSFSLFARYLFL